MFTTQKLDLRELHDMLRTDDPILYPNVEVIRKLLDDLNAEDPAILADTLSAIRFGVRPINELQVLFRNASRGYNDFASRAVEATRKWLRTYLMVVPLISRLELADPAYRYDSTQGAYVANEFLEYAGIKTPTDDEANASFIISYIIGQSRAGLVQSFAISEESMAESIIYISLNMPEVELLILELKKRGAFDKGTLSLLLSTNTSSLMSGEL